MGDMRTGEIYEAMEGQLRNPNDVPLTKEQADELKKLGMEQRLAEFRKLKDAQSQVTPTQGACAIDDDLTNTKVVLWEMIQAHQKSDKKSRERSLLITKLQEARMWADEAQAQS